MTWRLRGDHRHVDGSGRRDFAEVNVEPVREHQRLAGERPDCWSDRALVDGTLLLIGDEHHDHVARAGGIGDGTHLEPVSGGPRPRLPSRPETDDHFRATVAQVLRVRMSLTAVANDSEDAIAQARAAGA